MPIRGWQGWDRSLVRLCRDDTKRRRNHPIRLGAQGEHGLRGGDNWGGFWVIRDRDLRGIGPGQHGLGGGYKRGFGRGSFPQSAIQHGLEARKRLRWDEDLVRQRATGDLDTLWRGDTLAGLRCGHGLRSTGGRDVQRLHGQFGGTVACGQECRDGLERAFCGDKSGMEEGALQGYLDRSAGFCDGLGEALYSCGLGLCGLDKGQALPLRRCCLDDRVQTRGGLWFCRLGSGLTGTRGMRRQTIDLGRKLRGTGVFGCRHLWGGRGRMQGGGRRAKRRRLGGFGRRRGRGIGRGSLTLGSREGCSDWVLDRLGEHHPAKCAIGLRLR